MNLDELTDSLSGADDLESTESYVVRAARDERFVAPPLISADSSAPERVVLISAPAAVGKTMLANHLGVETHAPVWDLSRLRLGDAVLIGSLGRAYGYTNLGEIVPRLASGDLSLILDGIDEAYVRSGVEGLEALAADVAEILNSGDRSVGWRVRFVVLGRLTAIELFGVALEDRGVGASHLSIGFFKDEAAIELIDNEAGDAVARPGYAETRDKLVAAIRRSIGQSELDADDDTGNTFLGYAPVLSALGRYLADPVDVANALAQQAAQGAAFWDELIRINYEILVREQRKVWAQLDVAERVSDAFFSVDHQVKMLLAEHPLSLVERGWEAEDPDARRQAVEGARTAMENHPFLAADRLDAPLVQRFVNTVFRDFLVAEALRGDDLEVFIRINDAFWSGEYAPSSLAAFFYLRPDVTGRAVGTVDPELFSLIYASLTADSVSRDEPVTTVIAQENGQITVSVGRHQVAQTVDFEVDPTDVVVLAAPLAHTSITLDAAALEIRAIGDEVALGPRFTAKANRIEVNATRIWVDANHSAPVLLATNELAVLGSHLDIRQSQESALVVETTDAPYPFRQFVIPPRPSDTPAKLHDALMDLRRLVVWFEAGPSGQAGVSYPKKPLDNAVRKGRISRDMLDYSLEAGLLESAGRSYRATPERVKLDLFLIRRGQADRHIQDFLLSFLEWRRRRPH